MGDEFMLGGVTLMEISDWYFGCIRTVMVGSLIAWKEFCTIGYTQR